MCQSKAEGGRRCLSHHPLRHAAVEAVALSTGAPREVVDQHLRSLAAESRSLRLKPPSDGEVADWSGDMLCLIEQSGAPIAEKDHAAALLARGRGAALNGDQWHALSMLPWRVRQQLLVEATTAVDLDPPGSHAHAYTRGTDGRPTHVWYASYGSNMRAARFDCYLTGGTPNGTTHYQGARDKTPPSGDIGVKLPGTVHFAGESRVWGKQGVAFLDPSTRGRSLGRAYRITAEQFDDVVSQESRSGAPPTGAKVDLAATITRGHVTGRGLYGRLVHVGDFRGDPVVTFTSAFTARDALRGDQVVTPEGRMAKWHDRARARQLQAWDQAYEDHSARREGRPPVRVPSDWPVYSSPPSEAYESMIGTGLEETFGLSQRQQETYLAGCTDGT